MLSSPKLKDFFPPNSIISSLRRSKNLKEILAPSKCRNGLSQSISVPTAGCFYCDKTRCHLCKKLFVISQTLSRAQTGKMYFIWQRLACNSTNVVYLVRCKKCNLHHVGSTTTEFKLLKLPYTDFTSQCIDQIQTSTSENTDNLLITKETYWSAQLFSLSPFGLNKRQEFHSKNRIHYV